MTKKRYRIEAICRDRSGRRISSAFNSYTKTHPLQAHFAELAGEPHKLFLHAELAAIIRAADKKVHSLEIVNHSSSLLPNPCVVCQAAISAYGIKNLVLKAM